MDNEETLLFFKQQCFSAHQSCSWEPTALHISCISWSIHTWWGVWHQLLISENIWAGSQMAKMAPHDLPFTLLPSVTQTPKLSPSRLCCPKIIGNERRSSEFSCILASFQKVFFTCLCDISVSTPTHNPLTLISKAKSRRTAIADTDISVHKYNHLCWFTKPTFNLCSCFKSNPPSFHWNTEILCKSKST